MGIYCILLLPHEGQCKIVLTPVKHETHQKHDPHIKKLFLSIKMFSFSWINASILEMLTMTNHLLLSSPYEDI